jgi:hypothetical protein|tara:strand:+ start:344 stop:595 length:252 start_codon:yes stop_codon:yes gene_type:complete
MTKKELRELIKSVIKEYTGTGSSGGNSTDGNNITSPRPFADDQDEVENYANKNVGYGAMGNHTSGMEKTQSIGNPNRTRFTKF